MISAECGYTDIVEALVRTDASVEHLHKQGCDVYDSDGVPEDNTALMLASARGHTGTVRVLIAADGSTEHIGIRRNIMGYFGETALILAAREGHIDVVRELIAADSSAEHIRQVEDMTCSAEDSGQTALLAAVESGHTEVVVRELIAADGSAEHLQMKNSDGHTALDEAVEHGHEDIIALLA